MLYGLYLSAQGANAQSQRLDVIANNIANASTTGFKRDLAIFRQMDPHDKALGLDEDLPRNLNDHTGGLVLDEVATDFANGPLSDTGSNLDIAITGPGFLQVSDGQKQFLTRDGQMSLNGNGELVTQEGSMRVLNAAGVPVTLPPNTTDVSISDTGAVSISVDNKTMVPLTQLGLVTPQDFKLLEKQGENLFTSHGPVDPAAANVSVKQGYLEESSVEPVSEMLQMIETSRAFESNLNMAKYQDESLGLLLGSLARV
ncbi:Flagellar basal-body rod protein FlgG [Polystyrenella longa]|uniref:Flagellar basal-body rod protein FlgG n=1 Tax=Polystyrenella longa TaxID=2528007 RepID=A0A518CIS3_9PLAN|nr:flagellar basal-body rod protein FlgF [Polystyrenella longa]QDU79133.1 Flagellar basal-body rod protein FlgG [Polystyrenella longa]